MVKIKASSFKKLIGIWKTTGQIISGKDRLQLDGTDSYEYILDQNYILHKADVNMGNERSETFEIIELAGSKNKATMHYYNSKGESGIMTANFGRESFEISGDGIRFSGNINDEGTEIVGKWYKHAENEDWTAFIEIKLQKQV